MKTAPFLPFLSLATGLLLTAEPANAQMAEGLDPSDLAPATAAQAGQGSKPEAAAAPAEAPTIQASRYAGEEVAAYVRQLSARFSIRKRSTDPFGRHQDPDYVAPEPKVANKSPMQRFKAEPPMPFADVVSGIAVNTVIPAKQQFLIGSRIFRVNDVIQLRLPSGKQVGAKVLAVSSARIRFRNVTTNETADLTLNVLPPGVQRGTGTIRAPGVPAMDSQAPVDIQPPSPLSNNP